MSVTTYDVIVVLRAGNSVIFYVDDNVCRAYSIANTNTRPASKLFRFKTLYIFHSNLQCVCFMYCDNQDNEAP